MTLPSVSVVIPTYKRRHMLGSVIGPVLADPATREVVVVVDGCADGSIEFLEEWATREPRLRPHLQPNAGGGHARQKGVELATSDVVVVLDDDVVAGPGLVSKHARWHVDGADRVVLGYMPTTIPAIRRPADVTTRLYAADYEKVCARYEADPSYLLASLWSGNLSMRRETALRVGFANQGGIRHHEDQQLGFRCARAGVTGVFDRSIESTHEHVRTIPKFAAECRSQGFANLVLSRSYPDLMREASPLDGFSGPLRAVIRLLSVRQAAPRTSAVLQRLTVAAGRLHLWPLEEAGARLLRQVEVQIGLRGTR